MNDTEKKKNLDSSKRASSSYHFSETVVRNIILLTIIIVFSIYVQIQNDNFLTLNSIGVIGLNISFIGIAAIGTALLMIGGQIDLSIGSIFAFAAVISGLMASLIDPQLAIVVGVLSGGMIGLINGLIVWRINISPIIVTLGALTFVRGLVLIITDDKSVTGIPENFTILGRTVVLGLPLPVIIFLVIGVLAGLILSFTRVGLRIRAFGDNKAGAELSGLSGRNLTLGLFFFSGLVSGLAGVLATSRLGGASPNFGIGFELEVITAVVLGGVAITGGEGRITGVALSVVLLGVVKSGITALGLDPNIGRLIVGGALIGAVALNQLGVERHNRSRRKQAMAEFAADGGVADRLGLTKSANRDGD